MELKRLNVLGLLLMAMLTVTAAISAATASAEITLPQFCAATAGVRLRRQEFPRNGWWQKSRIGKAHVHDRCGKHPVRHVHD